MNTLYKKLKRQRNKHSEGYLSQYYCKELLEPETCKAIAEAITSDLDKPLKWRKY